MPSQHGPEEGDGMISTMYHLRRAHARSLILLAAASLALCGCDIAQGEPTVVIGG